MQGDEKGLLHRELTHSAIGGMYNVHTELGVGFAEPVYAKAAQLRNYLRASGLSVGLLLNFGSRPEYKRVILTPEFAHPGRRAPA